tara:strand:+ start:1473 stop:1781 length:309 start_codon:yes stop_codon:yes gene_type:complete
VLLFGYLYPEFIEMLVVVVFFISTFAFRTKEEIKEEYTAKVPWYGVWLGLSLSVAFVMSAVTGYTEYLNSLVTVENTRFWVLIVSTFLLLGYAFLIYRGREK